MITKLHHTPWDVTTAEFLQLFSVADEDGVPRDIFFKPDGLKMYMVGSSSKSVHEYDLSAAWDISTAGYSQSFSVADEDTFPQGLSFKADGLKMYMTGSASDSVHEYNLSAAWDISTAVYSQSFSVASEDFAPRGLFFKPDGLKMYMSGSTSSSVHEYNLSAAWDISTAGYSQSFSVADEDTFPQGLFFKPDGLKMYVMGDQYDSVHEYNLSAAWDISTAVYSQSFSVAIKDTLPMGLFFKPDGLKMYVMGYAHASVYEYNLPEAPPTKPYPTPWLNKNRISGYHCFMDQYMRAKRTEYDPLKLPDGTVF